MLNLNRAKAAQKGDLISFLNILKEFMQINLYYFFSMLYTQISDFGHHFRF
jgi:hypothetical protein